MKCKLQTYICPNKLSAIFLLYIMVNWWCMIDTHRESSMHVCMCIHQLRMKRIKESEGASTYLASPSFLSGGPQWRPQPLVVDKVCPLCISFYWVCHCMASITRKYTSIQSSIMLQCTYLRFIIYEESL